MQGAGTSCCESIYSEDTHLAAGLSRRYPGVSARDLLHTAVMLRLRTSYIISADTKLDQIPGIQTADVAMLDQTGAGKYHPNRQPNWSINTTTRIEKAAEDVALTVLRNTSSSANPPLQPEHLHRCSKQDGQSLTTGLP